MRAYSGYALRLGRAKLSHPFDLVRSSQAALLILGKGRSLAIDVSAHTLNMETPHQRLRSHTMVLVFRVRLRPLSKTLDQGTGYMFLLFSWGLLLWQSFALGYGRRIPFLLSILGTIAVFGLTPFHFPAASSRFLQPLAHSPHIRYEGEWLVRCAIQDLPEILVTDIVCAHFDWLQRSGLIWLASTLHLNEASTWQCTLSQLLKRATSAQ